MKAGIALRKYVSTVCPVVGDGGRSTERDPEELPKFPLKELEKKKEQREPQQADGRRW